MFQQLDILRKTTSKYRLRVSSMFFLGQGWAVSYLHVWYYIHGRDVVPCSSQFTINSALNLHSIAYVHLLSHSLANCDSLINRCCGHWYTILPKEALQPNFVCMYNECVDQLMRSTSFVCSHHSGLWAVLEYLSCFIQAPCYLSRRQNRCRIRYCRRSTPLFTSKQHMLQHNAMGKMLTCIFKITWGFSGGFIGQQ